MKRRERNMSENAEKSVSGRPGKIGTHNLVRNRQKGRAKEKSNPHAAYRDELPEFCKIYVPSLCYNTMRVPPELVKKFGENMPSNVTLRIQYGLSWQVNVHRICEHWFFQNGWQNFVLENSVEDGDFLTFSYAGDSIFYVNVFGRNGCRKRSSITHMVDEKPVETMDAKEECEPEYNPHKQATEEKGIPKYQAATNTGQRNPTFSVNLGKSNIDHGYLHIPISFWREHIRGSHRTIVGKSRREATLWHGINSWQVSLLLTHGRVRLSQGWKRFMHDNSLKCGSFCTFELLDGVDLSFNVTLCR